MSTEKVNVNDLYELWLVGAHDESVITAEEEFFKKTVYNLTEPIQSKDDLRDELALAILPTVEHITYNIFPEVALDQYGDSFTLVKNNGEEITVNSDNADEVLPKAVIEKMNNDDLTLEDCATVFADEIIKNTKDIDKLIQQINDVINSKTINFVIQR